jgi:exopolysaccharide production protein ExoQ
MADQLVTAIAPIDPVCFSRDAQTRTYLSASGKRHDSYQIQWKRRLQFAWVARETLAGESIRLTHKRPLAWRRRKLIQMQPSRRQISAMTQSGAHAQPNAWTTPTLFWSVALISVFANGNLHPQILPVAEDSNLQQYIGVSLWILVIATSYFRKPTLRLSPSVGLVVGLGLYALAIASPLWATSAAISWPKAGALAIITFGAYRLTRSLPFDLIVEGMLLGMLGLCTASVVVAILLPDIGVLKTWQHAGQWNGIFPTKQNLGILAALLLFFSAYRLLTPRWLPYHALGAGVAIICIVMSGSRGGGALAVLAVVCLYLTGVSRPFARVLAFAPFIMSLAGAALIAYFVKTGAKYLTVFGEDLDFTERSFIWQHALSYFPGRKWLGFGLNGFWTLPEVKDLFVERYGWFLDNYHDGYIAIAMETGITGIAIFIAAALFFGFRILACIRRERGLEPQVSLALVYTCLLFFIDFTETFFLRSTNIAATLLLVSFIIVYGRPISTARTVESRTPVKEREPRLSRRRFHERERR